MKRLVYLPSYVLMGNRGSINKYSWLFYKVLGVCCCTRTEYHVVDLVTFVETSLKNTHF